MPSVVIAAVAGIVTLYIVFRQLLRLTQDPREPPLVAAEIPFLTPVIGTLRSKSRFYSYLRDRYALPICTLRLPGMRLYVVNTPHLISSVQKNFKVLTFQAVTDKFSGLICDTSKDAQDIQRRQLEEWQQSQNAAPSPSHTAFKALSPGWTLDEMNRAMVARLAKELETLIKEGEKTTGLFEWIKEMAGIATTDGVYGEKNPYRDPEFRKSFWDYEEGLPTLSLGVLPNLLAPKCTKARKRLGLTLEHYFSSGDYLKGPNLTQTRYDWHVNSGFSLSDIAKFEVGNGIAILSNTVPTAYWVVYHIFSNSTVLSSCRDEVLQHVSTDSDGNKHLDTSKLKTSCPLLLSAFKESMRVHSVTIGMRQVMSDTILDGQYLLKKGALVMMPSKVQHSDPDMWGVDVGSYNHERFTSDPKHIRPRANPICFRAFGGGTTLCPGRHFATTEVLVLVAMLMLRFEIVPTDEGGRWKEMSSENAPMTAAMPKPDEDVEVVFKQRSDDNGIKWVFSLTEGDKGLAIAAEDIEGEAEL